MTETQTASTSCLTLVPVEEGQEVETLRQIRNDCRQCMTRYQDEITRSQQTAWWNSLDRRKTRPFLLKQGYEPIGYGLIRRDEKDRLWLTGALKEEYRGNGYGRFLFQSLVDLCEGECWLEVWQDNVPALRLYESLGFEVQGATVGGNGERTLLTMKRI